MAIDGFGPFDNDDAFTYVNEFLDEPSPAKSIRAALAPLQQDRYHQVDEVCNAWAACELVAISVTGGRGYEPEDFGYESAARLRPNKELIAECLSALNFVLDDNSELRELVAATYLQPVQDNIARTRNQTNFPFKGLF